MKQQAIDILDEMIEEYDHKMYLAFCGNPAIEIDKEAKAKLIEAKSRIQALGESSSDGWIKIDPKDRDTQPEPDAFILVSYIGFNNFHGVREATADCQRDGKTIDYLDGMLQPIENVTYWMPLPLPPKQ